MIEKLDWVQPRFEELGALLSDPEVVQDQEKWRKLMREHNQLEPLYVDTNEKVLSISFDAAWGRANTEGILSISCHLMVDARKC